MVRRCLRLSLVVMAGATVLSDAGVAQPAPSARDLGAGEIGAADADPSSAATEASPERMQFNAWPQPAAGRSASGDPELILTFDDGPSPHTTAKVLDILDRYDVRGVFFLQAWRFTRGDLVTASALVTRMVAGGHVVANHTIDHARLCTIEPGLRTHQIRGARAILERVAAMPVPWFRAPYGERCRGLEDELAASGIRHFHWDIDPQEWRNRGPRFTTAKVIEKLMYLRERAVLIMHDTKEATLISLPAILDWIAAENQRRIARGRRPIRILSGAALAAEQVAPAAAWVERLGRSLAAEVDAGLRAALPSA